MLWMDQVGNDYPQGGWIRKSKPEPTDDTPLKPDGTKYKTVKVGNQVWLAENYIYNPYTDKTEAIANGFIENPENGIGMYYTQTAVPNVVIPEGWHIPTIEDFRILYGELDLLTGNPIEIDSGSGGKYKDVPGVEGGARLVQSKLNDAGFEILNCGRVKPNAVMDDATIPCGAENGKQENWYVSMDDWDGSTPVIHILDYNNQSFGTWFRYHTSVYGRSIRLVHD